MKRTVFKLLSMALMIVLMVTSIAAFVPAMADTEPSGIKLNKKSITLKVKETFKIKVTFSPEGAKSKLTYKTSDKSIATVSKKGVVTAKSAGKATITVTTANGKSAKLKVKVTAPEPKKVKLNKTGKVTLKVGKTLQLKATLSPKTAKTKLTWSSSDKSIAKVSKKGLVTALKAGTATITVKTSNGKKASVKIKVKASTTPTSETTTVPTPEYTPEPTPTPTPVPTPTASPISVDKHSISVNAGGSYTVIVTYPGNNDISWSIDDSSVAFCKWKDGWNGDTCELTVTGLKAGTATVTVYDNETYDADFIQVTVKGNVGKVTELGYLIGKDIRLGNAMVDHKMTYSGDGIYTGDYFSVAVNDDNIIRTVGFFNNYGAYTLMGLWPGRSISSALNLLTSTGWKLLSDKSQIGTFTNSELPGCILQFKYANSKVSYIIMSY